MNHTLTLTVYYNVSSNVDLKVILMNTFNTEPVEYYFPFSKEILNEIEKQYGRMLTFKLNIVSTSYETAVFNLLQQLESFGFDWKFRAPAKIDSDKYCFIASLFPEFGSFYQPYFTGMTAVLNEEPW